MQRDPVAYRKSRYFRYITVKKCFPLIYHTCINCGKDYKLEKMMVCRYPNQILELMHEVYGCTHCFSSLSEFKETLENSKIIYTEENWIDERQKLADKM